MTCWTDGKVYVCAPDPDAFELKKIGCGNCNKRSWFVCVHYEWYGWNVTCLRCGDTWEDGEMLPRPWMPQWREKSIANAENQYRRLKDRERGGLSVGLNRRIGDYRRPAAIRRLRPNLYNRKETT